MAAVAACAACGEGSHVHAAARAGDIGLPSGSHVVTARVSRGDTLASLLLDNDVQTEEVNDVVSRTRAVFDPRRVRVDQPYRLEQANDGGLQRFEYQIDGDRLLRVRRSGVAGNPFVAEVVAIEKTREVTVVRGTIDRQNPSLFAAMDAAGEGINLSLGLADVFGGDIDFNTDLQPGDRFELLVEVPRVRCGDDAVRRTLRVGPRVRRLRADPRRRIRQRRPPSPRRALRAEGGRRRLLRRSGPVDAALLPALAAQVPADRHLRVLARADAPDSQDRPRASRRRLPRAVQARR